MKHEQDEMNQSSVSPSAVMGSTLSADTASLYANLFHSGHGMLTPQQLIMSRLVTPNFYPHPLFGSWPLPSSNTSPPISPISPALSVKSVKKINNNNNIVSTTTNELITSNNNTMSANNNSFKDAAKKPTNKRKTSRTKKKVMGSPMLQHGYGMEISQDVIPGPISPPTSGSSPQSIGSLEHQSPSSSSVTTAAVVGKDTTRDKNFMCKTCNRSFGYKHVLQNHERTHTGEKPFKCLECNKRFTRDHHLKTHMRLHTGEKPYMCKYCEKRFVQVANLRRHLRVHTGEKPYSCDPCQIKFSDSNQLKAHMLGHSDVKQLECGTCRTTFRHRNNLHKHKCSMRGVNSINSPPTPAMSPAMSIDNKSTSSRSDLSEHSLELSISAMKQMHLKQELQAASLAAAAAASMDTDETEGHQMPLDLSMEESPEGGEKRTRKSSDVRRILRMPTQILHIPTNLPEQTEPEDLSMHSPRSASEIDDLDDLDDAESLNRKHVRTAVRFNPALCDQKFENVDALSHPFAPKQMLAARSPTAGI